MSVQAVPAPFDSAIEAWKQHVLQCGLCGNAKSVGDLCPIGRNFWRPSEVIYAAQPAPQVVPQIVPQIAPPVFQSIPEPTVVHAVPVALDVRAASQIAEHVVARVIARASSGAAIAVPMEKTSRAISFSTAPGVVMHMPERDIEVYAEMQSLIRCLVQVAGGLSHVMSVSEETEKLVKSTPGMEKTSEGEVALIVQQARARFGLGNDEELYAVFMDAARRVLKMGDRLGNFMRVDEETRRIIKAARTLAIDMQEILERSVGGVLKLDEAARRVIKPMRLFAIDLQGEIERRLGTP